MFNKIYQNHNKTVDVTTTVTEKRAPTDESVRLLKEMESAARAKIIEVIEVKSNIFTAKAVYWDNCPMNAISCTVLFDLNGTRKEFSFSVDNFESVDGRLKQFYEECTKQMGRVLIEAIAQGTAANIFLRK